MSEKKSLVCTEITWDWKESPTKEELTRALEPFGVQVTEHPDTVGSDSFGFIFSNRSFTKEELKKMCYDEENE